MNELIGFPGYEDECYVRCPSSFHRTAKCKRCCFYIVHAPADQNYTDSKGNLVSIRRGRHTSNGNVVDGLISVYTSNKWCDAISDTWCKNGYTVRQAIFNNRTRLLIEREYDPPGLIMSERHIDCHPRTK